MMTRTRFGLCLSVRLDNCPLACCSVAVLIQPGNIPGCNKLSSGGDTERLDSLSTHGLCCGCSLNGASVWLNDDICLQLLQACPGELSNMVVVPCWEKSQQDSCLGNLVSVLLQILDGMDPATDLRLYSEAISSSLAAMGEVDNSHPPADPNQLLLDEELESRDEASAEPAAPSPGMAASSQRQRGLTADPNEVHRDEGPEILEESSGEAAADPAGRPWTSREPEAGRRYSKGDLRKDRSGEGTAVQYGVQKAGIHA